MRDEELSNVGERDAVPINSGQPVDHSGPGLNEPTPSPTSGRKPEARPPVQPKSGRGLGQSPRGCAAAQPSFLDEIEINRNNPRGKHCGRYSAQGWDDKSGTTLFCRIYCKCWNCSYCAPRKAKRYKKAISSVAEARELCRFVTLTLDPAKVQGDSVRYLNRVFAKLRIYLKRQFGVAPAYIRVLEFQQNGNPHFHLLIDRYVEWAWLKRAWQAVGGGSFVNIKFVDVGRVSHYLSKYLTKDLLLSAPLRSRRVTTSRDIHLFEKNRRETPWKFLKIPILLLYKCHRRNRYRTRILTVDLDEGGVLRSFSAISERAEVGMCQT